MAYKHLSELKQLLVDKPARRLVLAAAQDHNSLSSVLMAARDGFIEPILVGDRDAIHSIAAKNNFDLTGIRVVHEPDSEMAIEISVRMVRSNQADILMKGKVGTSNLLKAVLNKEWGLRSGSLLSHFAIFEVAAYHKLIAVTDVAMNIAPNLQDKIAIVNNSVACLNRLGVEMPKVAVLGAVEMVSENMQATLDAAKRRMRPIFLTSSVAAMGVLPLIISQSPMWAPMGTIIFFGALITMVFIVFVLPVLYWLVYQKEDSANELPV